MNEIYPSTNNEAVIRAIFIEDKKLIRENKLRIGIITLEVSEIKKVSTPKAYDFIMSDCEEYKKDDCYISHLLNIYFLAVPLVSDLALCTVSNNSGNIFP